MDLWYQKSIFMMPQSSSLWDTVQALHSVSFFRWFRLLKYTKYVASVCSSHSLPAYKQGQGNLIQFGLAKGISSRSSSSQFCQPAQPADQPVDEAAPEPAELFQAWWPPEAGTTARWSLPTIGKVWEATLLLPGQWIAPHWHCWNKAVKVSSWTLISPDKIFKSKSSALMSWTSSCRVWIASLTSPTEVDSVDMAQSFWMNQLNRRAQTAKNLNRNCRTQQTRLTIWIAKSWT